MPVQPATFTLGLNSRRQLGLSWDSQQEGPIGKAGKQAVIKLSSRHSDPTDVGDLAEQRTVDNLDQTSMRMDKAQQTLS